MKTRIDKLNVGDVFNDLSSFGRSNCYDRPHINGNYTKKDTEMRKYVQLDSLEYGDKFIWADIQCVKRDQIDHRRNLIQCTGHFAVGERSFFLDASQTVSVGAYTLENVPVGKMCRIGDVRYIKICPVKLDGIPYVVNAIHVDYNDFTFIQNKEIVDEIYE